LYDQAGDRNRTIDVLERFVASHGSDERVPEARFLLGQALQAAGLYDDAIAVYRANLQTRDPSSRHIKAVEGLIPMAMCCIAKGEEFFGDAEEILYSLVTGRAEVTPTSALYRQALFALGRLYYRQGQWRQARKTLAEAVERDPGKIIPLGQSDPKKNRWRYIRATRSTYFIADSYLHSARDGLRASIDADREQRNQLRENAHTQLARADELYQEVIERLEALDGELDPLNRVFRRNGYFARGDCMYELGRYEDALDRYSQAVHKFQHRPEALAGLTAMYNCYAELGRPDEAEACRERAAELRKHLNGSQADPSTDPAVLDRWDRWLETVKYLNPDVSDEGQS
jgi:tetratricopeptide (TPR) repeat protein